MLAIFGPTAAGKSALAHAAALELGGEIVVADPFQRYRGLEVAADAPRPRERAEVTYHLAGDLDLREPSSAGDYAPRAHRAIDAILARGRIPIASGGTGLYLRAAVADLEFPPAGDPAVRGWAEARVAADPAGAVAELRARDPAAAERIDARNPRRLVRALELAVAGEVAGRPSDVLWDARATRHPTLLIAVTRPRAVLDRLIAERVRRELADGLVAELERAAATPDICRAARQIIGMREVAELSSGALRAGDLADRLAARTRRLARRQLAWLRRTEGAVEIDLGERPAVAGLPELLGRWAEFRGPRVE